MTQGEKMVWAATYAAALERRLRESYPELQYVSSLFSDRIVDSATLDASDAVTRLRKARARVPHDPRDQKLSEHVEMLNEMLGINVEPPLR